MNTPAVLAGHFKTIAFVAVPVKDIARARSFYEGTLGLKVTANWENQWIEYDIGESTIAVTAMFPGREPGARGAMIALEVANFDALLAGLRDKQVPFTTEPFDTPVCRGATITDPDGNEILLHARK